MTCLQELFFRLVSSDAVLQTQFFRLVSSDAVLQTHSSRCFKLQINSFAFELVQSESLRIVLWLWILHTWTNCLACPIDYFDTLLLSKLNRYLWNTLVPTDASSIWHKDVPLKVVLFAWRLFRDRLPTKDNLLRRGVIHFDSRLCVAGCGTVETSHHLFLHCNFFGTVWHSIYSWIGISVANPLYVSGHFHQFGFCGGLGRRRRSILQVIWFATVWEIWKERNNRLFKGKECPVFQVVDRIKSSPICGWRRSTLLFPSIYMAGGLVCSPCCA